MGYDEDNDDTTWVSEANPPPTTALRKWADEAMFTAEPHESDVDTGVLPTVTLLWMTPDPLGAIAAMSEMYKGNVVRNLADITDDIRRSALEDVQQTHLQAPLEAVKLHFMIEGVDRAFTHQLVRQRTAVYAQESMRFAVVEGLANATTLPPSLQGTVGGAPGDTDPGDQAEANRRVWDHVIDEIQAGYDYLVDNGMPAEEARGLLPHCTATRLNYVTDLRNLVGHAGNRLCTQAQFVWRIVFSEIVQAIRNYDAEPEGLDSPDLSRSWQFEALAASNMFRPVCYQLGHCPFKASFDRACSIRDRVDLFAQHGIESKDWEESTVTVSGVKQGPISPKEWLMNPAAARVPYGSR